MHLAIKPELVVHAEHAERHARHGFSLPALHFRIDHAGQGHMKRRAGDLDAVPAPGRGDSPLPSSNERRQHWVGLELVATRAHRGRRTP